MGAAAELHQTATKFQNAADRQLATTISVDTAIGPVLRSAFSSAFAAGSAAVKAALAVSVVDGSPDGRNAAIAALRGFATSSWKKLLDFSVGSGQQ